MVIHHVFANRSNIGDWLSARGIQKVLHPLSVVEHLCDEPFVPETLRALRQCDSGDLIVIGGGGLFMDYFLPFWSGLLEIIDRVPVCLWGVGSCDLKRESSRLPVGVLERIAARSRLCFVRDKLSQSLLAKPDLPDPVPCPSLNYLDRVGNGHGLLHVDNYTTAGADVYDAMTQYGQEFAARTGRRYDALNNRITAGRDDEMAKMLGRYARADVVLSSGLHGCVIGLAMGRKVVAVSGDRKIEAFMAAMGLADWVCDIQDVHRIPGLLAAVAEQPAVDVATDHARLANKRIASLVQSVYQDVSVSAENRSSSGPGAFPGGEQKL